MNRALAVAAGLALQKVLPEPPDRWHPTAWFGTTMQAVEDVGYADSRAAGARHLAIGVGIGLLAGRVVGSPALAVGVCAAGRGLRQAASAVEDELVAGDLTAARSALRSLAGRDASELDESGIAAAVIESLAENSVDAVMASAFWGLVAGAPGVFAHRAVNTLDAMVGHHNARYENFGWAAARVDDAAAWAPARAYAALIAAATPRRAADVRRLVARDAAAHPSPNAGVAETAVAAALGRELGGPLRYGDRVEERPRLGDGPRPQAADIRAARTLTSRAEWVLISLLVLIGWSTSRGQGRPVD